LAALRERREAHGDINKNIKVKTKASEIMDGKEGDIWGTYLAASVDDLTGTTSLPCCSSMALFRCRQDCFFPSLACAVWGIIGHGELVDNRVRRLGHPGWSSLARISIQQGRLEADLPLLNHRPAAKSDWFDQMAGVLINFC
jgi:hypothetical protein